MSISNASILTNLILKNKIIEEFANKYNISENFVDKHYNLFLEYANIQIELLQYNSIPLDELKNFNKLNFRQAKFFIRLHHLLDTEIKKI